MGVLCCFSAAAETDEKHTGNPSVKVEQSCSDVKQAAVPSREQDNPSLAERHMEVDKPRGNLNESESAAVKHTLMKVSELIERFAEGSAEREAPLHALKKALQLVAADCHASYVSMSVVSMDQSSFLVMGAVGSSHEATTIPNTVQTVQDGGSSVAMILKGKLPTLQQHLPGSSIDSNNADNSSQPLHWSNDEGLPPPSDWVALQRAGIRHIHAMPIRSSPNCLLAVLNLGFKHEPCLDVGFMGPHLFSTYLSLVSATLTAVVRDPGLNAYVCLARDLAAATSLDGVMQAALLGSRAALTRLKGMAAAGSHTWLRLALISGDKSAAALFDDLSLAGVARGNTKRPPSGHGGSSNAQWVATIQAAGGLVRTNIPMKNTILRIALTNKKQVLIPDVQKLINQLGNVNTDLFASRLLRPPSSVLLLPLRASGVGIFGALYCLADVHTEFSEVAKQLKEVAELLGQGLNRQLSGPLLHEFLSIQQMNHEQLLQRDGGDGSHGSFGLGGPMGLTNSLGISHHSSGGISPSTVTPATTAGSLPGAQHSYSTTGSSSLVAAGGGMGRSESSFMAAATGGGALELGSTVCTNASWAGSMGGSFTSTGGSFSGPGGLMGRSFIARQVASSTNAVATGITEKLNQKRINAAMSEPEEDQLDALQLVAQIGEGGFAKVFRGLYRGLVVAVKVVSVGDPSNERAVMKNAHEIAILRSSSHPNIIQAYSCLTDVLIRDVIALCTRHAPQQQRVELIAALTACAGANTRPPSAAGSKVQPGAMGGLAPHSNPQQPPEDASCHIEVVEYCDLGNLTSAIRNHIFSLEYSSSAGVMRSRSARSCRSSAGASVDEDESATTEGSVSGGAKQQLQLAGADGSATGSSSSSSRHSRLRLNMRWLLLTLLEVAEGMAYLHRMGVVHCDLKPANVLLKSSNADVRGFTAKVSDFGLSRVEDDDTCSTFPFNSCGTAAYVAPEALITTKKVNASVDVYAFGIMMWEVFVGQRPYGNMSQQKVVEEVVLRGLRPSFPVGTPLGYTQLACSCWHATAGQRPSFQEIVGRLQAMLHQTEDSAVAAAVSVSLNGSEAWGGRADGLGIPPVPSQQYKPAGAGAQGSNTSPAAAAAIADAAAAWQHHHQQQMGMVQQQTAQGQLPAAQLLAWQQQQQHQQQQQPQQVGNTRVQHNFDHAHTAAALAKPAWVGDDLQKHSKHLAGVSQHDYAATAALAAAGSVYEFQQVGFGGETVVGTGLVGSARAASSVRRHRPSNGSNYSYTAPSSDQYLRGPVTSLSPAAQQQQLWLAAAAHAANGGHGSFDGSLLTNDQQHVARGPGTSGGGAMGASGNRSHRPPVRSKTFTAGTPSSSKQQHQQHLQHQQVAQLMQQMGLTQQTLNTESSPTNHTASSVSFNDFASSSVGGHSAAAASPDDVALWQQQQQVLLQHHQMLLQRQAQALLQKQDDRALNEQQHLQQPPGGRMSASFTFGHQAAGPRVGSSPVASAAAAIAAAQQKQQQQLARQTAAAAGTKEVTVNAAAGVTAASGKPSESG